MPNTFLAILGGLLSAIGAVAVLLPALTVKPAETQTWRVDPLFIAEFWRKEVYKQKRYTGGGILLIVIGTALQLIGAT